MNSDPLFLNPQVLSTIFIIISIYALGFNSTVRRLVLVSASVYFYLRFAGFIEFLVISFLTVSTYFLGKTRKSVLLMSGVALNIVAIVIAKFYLASFNSESASKLWIPLGISFFVFEFIHYLIEVKRGMKPESNLVKFVTFGLFFPTVVSGPIRRYTNFATQTEVLMPIRANNLMTGLFGIGLGFIYKFGADQFANYQDKMHYFQSYAGLKGGMVFLFVISMHIFLDFAGYSYIAIGIAKIIGINIPQNFNAPYLATSVINFWDRWHISLSSWVRDYLYIPLGGSRVKFLRQALNLLLCMAVIGLWHGLGFQFLIWGALQGFGLVVNHFIRRVLPRNGSQGIGITSTLVRWGCTMIFVSVSWVFFFYPPDNALSIIRSILSGFKI